MEIFEKPYFKMGFCKMPYFKMGVYEIAMTAVSWKCGFNYNSTSSCVLEEAYLEKKNEEQLT